MAPLTGTADEATHLALLDKLDIHATPKPFRNPTFKPPQRRNKNIRQILADAQRKEAASVLASHAASGTNTPLPSSGPANPSAANIAHSLSTLALSKKATSGSNSTGPAPTYTNIESAPSFHPSSRRRYCDVTGLPAPYTDPKTRLRYADKEVFAVVRMMPQGVYEGFLAARGAHTVLK